MRLAFGKRIWQVTGVPQEQKAIDHLPDKDRFRSKGMPGSVQGVKWCISIQSYPKLIFFLKVFILSLKGYYILCVT